MHDLSLKPQLELALYILFRSGLETVKNSSPSYYPSTDFLGE